VVALAIDPVTPATLYTSTGGGILKTTNGGGSWNAIPQSPFSVQAIVVDPSTPATLYAAGNSSGGGVFKSTNGGANWQPVNNGLTTTFMLSLAIDPVTPSTIYAGANGGLFKSVNGGGNWSSITNGLTSTFISTIAIDPVTPSTVYVGASSFSGGVFKSTNGGTNWTGINNGLKYPFVWSIVVNPTRPSTIYLGVNIFPPDEDAFVSKINPAGSAFVYSILLGGFPSAGDSSNVTDEAYAIAIDSAGNAYVVGTSRTPDFLVTPDAYQPFNRGFADAFAKPRLKGW